MTRGWFIWFATYGTYADPDVPPRLIAGPMSFDAAFSEVGRLGFGYCMKDHA